MSIQESENVIRPNHYGAIAGVESIRIMEAFNFNLGNAMKYIWRCGKKANVSAIEDLMKARQYIDFELARLLREESNHD
ncbi:MAG: DUF3310 domain-containing protein [Planctomycetaceae bacterium]|nr:DUF3310 domain-containing protein [Planctomycetaceae bacterium]